MIGRECFGKESNVKKSPVLGERVPRPGHPRCGREKKGDVHSERGWRKKERDGKETKKDAEKSGKKKVVVSNVSNGRKSNPKGRLWGVSGGSNRKPVQGTVKTFQAKGNSEQIKGGGGKKRLKRKTMEGPYLSGDGTKKKRIAGWEELAP